MRRCMGNWVTIFAAITATACMEKTKPENGAETSAIVQQVSAPPAPPAKRQWFGRNPSKSSCLEVDSPADKIREIQMFGQNATTNDLARGVVEVERALGDGRAEVWTFFPTMTQCEASLPRNQSISNRYE